MPNLRITVTDQVIEVYQITNIEEKIINLIGVWKQDCLSQAPHIKYLDKALDIDIVKDKLAHSVLSLCLLLCALGLLLKISFNPV